MDYSQDPSNFYHRPYVAADDRYKVHGYETLGKSGLSISRVSLGTWQNFSHLDSREKVMELYLTAFDRGIFSFDFGNNYGRPPGSAESLFGEFLKGELQPYREELVVSTKAGYEMWPGPNGYGSSSKYLVTSLDASLKRMGLDYVDIFYSHRYDPSTPLEEVAEGLDFIRRSGRAIYLGVSSYPVNKFVALNALLRERGSRLIVNQSNYSIFNNWADEQCLATCREQGIGFAAFSPLAQGLLTDTFLTEKQTFRSTQENSSLWANNLELVQEAVHRLHGIALRRGQTLAQLALSWALRSETVNTVVIGARTPEQIVDNTSNIVTEFDDDELGEIAAATSGIDVDLWKKSRLPKEAGGSA